MRIQSNGNVLINGTSESNAKILLNANGSASFANRVEIDAANRAVVFHETHTTGISAYSSGNLQIKGSGGSDTLSFIDFNFPDISTVDSEVRLFRGTNTTGEASLAIYGADGTANKRVKLKEVAFLLVALLHVTLVNCGSHC